MQIASVDIQHVKRKAVQWTVTVAFNLAFFFIRKYFKRKK